MAYLTNYWKLFFLIFIFQVTTSWKRNSHNIGGLSCQEKEDTFPRKGSALILLQMCLRSHYVCYKCRDPLLRTWCFQPSDSGFHSWKPKDEMSLPVVMSYRRNKLLSSRLYGWQISSLNYTMCSPPHLWIWMKGPTSTSLIVGSSY